MENNQIKKEVNQEADAFMKALEDRDKQIKFDRYLSPEDIERMKGQALRYNEGKLSWSMVDFDSLEGLVRVLEYGAHKYSKNNWKKGMPVTQVSESLMRHLFAFLRGEDVDPESGLRHISHVMCNAMFLEYILREKPHFDDRENKNNGL